MHVYAPASLPIRYITGSQSSRIQRAAHLLTLTISVGCVQPFQNQLPPSLRASVIHFQPQSEEVLRMRTDGRYGSEQYNSKWIREASIVARGQGFHYCKGDGILRAGWVVQQQQLRRCYHGPQQGRVGFRSALPARVRIRLGRRTSSGSSEEA